ncbi:hypothetical protein [uncultured Cyclobacterium sp.]|uniref:hypothetical protein n=1 Tax=uncultured Cyclobacterium sp. TaxID=453820 RepID=UPI0030EF9B41
MICKIHKSYELLNSRINSAKTLIDKAKREVSGFAFHIHKSIEPITIKTYVGYTFLSYTQSNAQISFISISYLYRFSLMRSIPIYLL